LPRRLASALPLPTRQLALFLKMITEHFFNVPTRQLALSLKMFTEHFLNALSRNDGGFLGAFY